MVRKSWVLWGLGLGFEGSGAQGLGFRVAFLSIRFPWVWVLGVGFSCGRAPRLWVTKSSCLYCGADLYEGSYKAFVGLGHGLFSDLGSINAQTPEFRIHYTTHGTKQVQDIRPPSIASSAFISTSVRELVLRRGSTVQGSSLRLLEGSYKGSLHYMEVHG